MMQKVAVQAVRAEPLKRGAQGVGYVAAAFGVFRNQPETRCAAAPYDAFSVSVSA